MVHGTSRLVLGPRGASSRCRGCPARLGEAIWTGGEVAHPCLTQLVPLAGSPGAWGGAETSAGPTAVAACPGSSHRSQAARCAPRRGSVLAKTGEHAGQAQSPPAASARVGVL